MKNNQLSILAIHAHPDDESLYTAGTLAHFSARGANVSVLTCTLGEEGEVIGERYAHLVASNGGADQLGGYRIHELTNALLAIGATAPQFLGGAGCFRDSGMLGTPANSHPRAFIKADREDVAELMACWIRRLKPNIVFVYDEGGTYGHPDHVKAHQCGVRAMELAADHADPDLDTVRRSGVVASADVTASSDYTEICPAWEVERGYWMMQSRSRLAAGLDAIRESIPDKWTMPEPTELFCTDDDSSTWVMELDEEAYAAKIAALQAHSTQVTVHTPPHGPVSFAMSNNIAQPLLRTEEFRLVWSPV